MAKATKKSTYIVQASPKMTADGYRAIGRTDIEVYGSLKAAMIAANNPDLISNYTGIRIIKVITPKVIEVQDE